MRGKSLLLVIALGLCALLCLSTASASSPEFKALPAKEIKLVKKSVLKGPPPWAGGGKKEEGAATGVLGEPAQGNKYAIVIGISDYPGEENDLKYADDDALAMRDVLVSVYGFPSENIKLLLDMNATANAIFSAVNEIKEKETAGDEVVFFFSGHGARGIAADGDGEVIDEAIVAHDGRDLVYIWDGQLANWFSEFDTTRIVFIFDCCLAGGMTDLAASGRIVNMATTERGLAYEIESLGHGEFTYYFVVLGMGEGEADAYDHDGDGSLGESSDVVVEEAFDYAKANCENDKPTISDNFENDLLL